METGRAIWVPCWYELDQTIAVGEAKDLYFFTNPRAELREPGCLVLLHGLASDEEYWIRPARVLSIHNKHFGAVQKIDTNGLDYTLIFPGGEIQKIEAEESPGWVYGWPEPIDDWRFYVDLEFTE